MASGDTGLELDGNKLPVHRESFQRVHQLARDLQAPRLRIDEHAFDFGRSVSCLDQRAAADDRFAISRDEKADGRFLKRRKIDEVVAFRRIERLRIGVRDRKSVV